jgi:regulator of sigma E protease
MSVFLKTLLSIVEFVLAFGALIFLHEFGHFIFARLNKIEVEEFGFGYPPRMIKLFRLWGTDFTLNWIPFGGFCRMKGESGETVEAGSFQAANPWRRLVTLLGGPITNLLIGMVIFAFLFTRTGAPDLRKVQVIGISPNSPAASANMKVGDIIDKVNDIPITSTTKLSQVISPNLGIPVKMELSRAEDVFTIDITPRTEWPSDEGPLGITISNPTIKLGFLQSIPMAFTTTIDQGVQLVMLPVKLISGQIAPAQARMVSVKGIYDIFTQVQTLDQQEAAIDPSMAGLNILWFLAVISIALGFTNLLPIPALDGGRIIFLVPELLFKKKVRPELEGRIHMIGYVILMALMVILVINDIFNPIVLPK